MKSQMDDWVATLQQDLSGLSEVFSTRTSVTPALLPGERRSVAVLFLDLKGFTSMSEQLDHEVVHKISSSVMSGLSRLVEFHGGYVDKFEGDRIMALFGAEKAHENDCVRAASCATRMIEVVKEFGVLLRDRGFPIDARCGVSYGDVTVAPDPAGHLTATGDHVNIASRMEETAETGTVQVTRAVRDTAGGLFEWKDLGLIAVKGKKERVNAFRPTGPGKVQIERWERATRLISVPFVGRKKELSELEGLLLRQSGSSECNRRGGAKHVIAGIHGAAGIGKSRLIHEFRKSLELRSEKVLVLKAGCASYAQPPLWLILSLIRDWLDLGVGDYPPAETVREQLEGKLGILTGEKLREDSARVLSSLLSAGETEMEDEETSGDRSKLQIQSSVTDLIRVLSDGSERLVIILDDVHWIDSASREVVEFLAANCDTKLPILFILLYRPQPAWGREIMEGLPEEYTTSSEIRLKDIDPESSRELIIHLLKAGIPSASEIPDSIVEFLLRSSGGNAFFIEELVLGMIESGLLSQDGEGEWNLSDSPESMVIPGSIKGLVRARTDHLPPEARKLLQVASVMGEEFNQQVLFRIAGNAGIETRLDKTFQALLDRRFMLQDEPDTVHFTHSLVRDAVYETILKRNRRVLHSLIADDLEERIGQDPNLADLLARHRADSGEASKAVPWAMQALNLASERYDGNAVLYWAGRLETWIRDRLDSTEDARLLVDVLSKRQLTEGLRLELHEQGTTLKKIDDLITEWNLPGLRGRYLMALGNLHSRSNDLPQALEVYEQALELFNQSGDRKGIAGATSDIALCNKQMGLTRQASEGLRYAISLFRELGDTSNTARALLRLASTIYLTGHYEEGLDILDEALELAREAVVRTVEASILNMRGVLQVSLERYEEALQSQRSALALSREVGDRSGELSSLNSTCNVFFRMRRLDEARKFGLEALQASRELKERRTEANVLCSLGLVVWGKKRHQEAVDYLQESLEAHERIGNKAGQAAVLWNLGLLSYDLLCFEEGIEYCWKSIELYRELGNRRRVAIKLTIHSITLAEMGRIDEAAACLEEYENDYSDIDDSNTRLRYIFARGEFALRNGKLDKAEDYYIRSIELARETNTNITVAQSLQNIGLIRLEQGRSEEAREYLREGFEAVDGVEFLETYLAYAEYFLMTGRNEDAIHLAWKAYARAESAGNEKTVKRVAEILKELGSHTTTNQQN